MTTTASGPVAVVQKRTGWDIALGIILILAGLVVLGDAVIATVVSVVFLGWMALFSGIFAFVAAFFKIGKGGFWPMLLGGGAVAVLGLFMLRNTGLAAVSLTLLAGALFFAVGITRIVAGFHDTEHRWLMIIAGACGVVLGLIVLLNLIKASFVLLGVLLGIQMLIEGVTILAVGRMHSR